MTSRGGALPSVPGRPSLAQRALGLPLFVFSCALTAATLVGLYVWKLDAVPPYLNQDEAGFGLASFLLATTGRDYFGNLLPVYVGYFDNHQVGGAMLAYWGVPFVKVLGLSVASIRLSMAVLGLLSLAMFGFLAWRFTGSRWMALLGAAVLGTSPLFFIQSRLFLELLLPVPFVIGWLICVVEFQKGRDGRFLLMSAAVLGASFYSYGIARMAAPIYLGLTLALLLLTRQCSWRLAVGSVAVFGVLMLPGLAFAIQNPDLYQARFRELTWLKEGLTLPQVLITYLERYVAAFDPMDLFVRGDNSLVHSTGMAGVYQRVSIPSAIVGSGWLIWRSVAERHLTGVLVLMAFLLFPVPLALLDETHAPARAAYAVPLYGVLCIAGLDVMRRWASARHLVGLALVCLVLVWAVEAGIFFADYFGEYQARAAASEYFSGNKPGAFRALMEGSSESAVFYDPEDATTTTYARFFKAESRFQGELLPAPPEWRDRVPVGGRVLTRRPDGYGAGFETTAVVPQFTPGLQGYTVLRKAVAH